MLITFRSSAYADITMFGEVAIQLLKLMGHSGTIPGALMPQDIPVALAQLKSAIARLEREQSTQQPGWDDDDDEPPPVALSHRALPLIELLQAAVKEDVPVMWDK